MNKEGALVPSEAQDRQTASSAIRSAEDMASGTVALSRTGDQNIGKFEDVVLRTFGGVPSLDGML